MGELLGALGAGPGLLQGGWGGQDWGGAVRAEEGAGVGAQLSGIQAPWYIDR